ncbi:MAG: cytochrome-c oxidase, cbb3-type subunit I [Bacteroidetes bacterium]|nr:cytochrome-c oxidase, cbb3-type subunit I [Bacteroidota bacterium]
MSGQIEKFSYDNRISRMFLYATLLWGAVGLLVGVLIAFQLYIPALNFDLPYTTFGRLRPLHTNAVIFAFVGNAIFAGVYYSLQRLLKARMFNDMLSKLHFWGWQLIIVCAALTLFLGISTGKEYAELEWPIDIMVALVWVIFGVNMIGTMVKRREKHLYVAIWFYLATFVTVAILHIVNSFEIPVNLFKSYSWYAGVQDAMVQWWYGHNAVAFFLTTPFLGLMYYFVPKAANRPVYSYRLSIVHFWALIFIYIWAGPHHLLYSAVPDWAQTLGVVFSLMLIAPSWGGMINGLLTMRGAWDRVRNDAILKFFVVALTAYGMATFEGPMHSLKTVNAFTHFTDWIPAHVHIGTLGWNGMMIFAIFYWMAPRLTKNGKLFSMKLANTHFWIATLGMILWSVAMYWAGTAQGLMWKQWDANGLLQHSFIDTVIAIVPMYLVRAIGGTLYLLGFFIFIYNILKTLGSAQAVHEEEAEAPALVLNNENHSKLSGYLRHRILEKKPLALTFWAAVAILVGTLIEMVPTFLVKSNVPTIASVQPYTPLELEGRDIYIREGCNSCHSQLIRPFRTETERYGEYSKAGEFVYDHPFLWGSKRTGPDLAREGGLRDDAWHFRHMKRPNSIYDDAYDNPPSIMPAYPWLITDDLDVSNTPDKIRAMQTLGVPYAEGYDANAVGDLQEQAAGIANNIEQLLSGTGEDVVADEIKNKEIIALIAYLQRLGTDISKDTNN